MGRVWILLPCYNEEKALPGVLAQLANFARTIDTQRWSLPLEVIVVDDGSVDRTWQLANEAVTAYSTGGLAIHPIKNEKNQGLGITMRTGIAAFVARAKEDDVLITMDADGSHTAPTIALMLEGASANHDIIIASRFAKGGRALGVPQARAFYSKLCSSVYRGLFHIESVKDYSSGFRLYSASILIKAGRTYGDSLITERSFACQAELLLKLARLGARCAEVPLILRYDLKPGPSKMRLGRTVWRYCLLALRESVRRTPVPKESKIDDR